MDITQLTSQYTVRELATEDIEQIYELAAANPLYYQHCPPPVTRESIQRDRKALPPGTTYDDKHYMGFFTGEKLVAVMDLIVNYPDRHTAFIGFFMVSREEQGKGTGSQIVSDCFRYLQALGYTSIRLGYAKGNPQSKAFWEKNGFVETGITVDNGDYTVVVLQKTLHAGKKSG